MSKKENIKVKDMFDVLEQLYEYDDRSAGIVGGAFLEESLTNLIESHLVDLSSAKNILNSSFHNKIELAKSLGLISKREYDDLKTIKEIRNKFAHFMKVKNFEDLQIKRLCEKLIFCRNYNDHRTIKESFSITIVTLSLVFYTREVDKGKGLEAGKDAYDSFSKLSKEVGNVICNMSNFINSLLGN